MTLSIPTCVRLAQLSLDRPQGLGRPFFGVSVRDMSEVERAYVGAMIDAEGAACLREGVTTIWELKVTNTDLEIISALLRATGAGRVYFAGFTVGGLSIWHWDLYRQKDVLRLCEQIHSYSQKAQRVLQEGWL